MLVTNNELIKKRALIFTGGILTPNVLPIIDKFNDIVIGVDKGAKWLIDHEIIPDYFVGDFDSVEKHFFDEIKNLYENRLHASPAEKDETDTELAIRLAISLQPKEIIILGGIGSRLDHVIANIHILLQAEMKNISAKIVGSSNRIQLVFANKEKQIEKSYFPYISLLPFSEKVEGIRLSGFKYPITNGTMEIGYPYGISNEIIEDFGSIFIEQGILIVIESKD